MLEADLAVDFQSLDGAGGTGEAEEPCSEAADAAAAHKQVGAAVVAVDPVLAATNLLELQ
jgi:hypothetical protein